MLMLGKHNVDVGKPDVNVWENLMLMLGKPKVNVGKTLCLCW